MVDLLLKTPLTFRIFLDQMTLTKIKLYTVRRVLRGCPEQVV